MEKKIAARFNVLPSRQKIMINPFIFDDGVEKDFIPLICKPELTKSSDVAADLGCVNIYKKFKDYSGANKSYIFAFTSSIATLTLSGGTSYRWCETISGVDYEHDVTSGTAFTAGSTNRYVIVNEGQTTATLNIIGILWAYIWNDIVSMLVGTGSDNTTTIKYLHGSSVDRLVMSTYVFARCESLTGTLYLPNNDIKLGRGIVYNDINITEIVLKEKTNFNISDEPFDSWRGKVTVDDNNSNYCSDNGTLYDKSKENLIICYLYSYSSVTIPSTVKHILKNAFREDQKITGLVFNQSLLSIGDYCFFGCSNLSGVIELPNSITSLGSGCFYECYKITEIKLSESMSIIPSAAFGLNYGLGLELGNLVIPTSITTIQYAAFARIKVSSLIINSQNLTIGDFAFIECVINNIMSHSVSPPLCSDNAFTRIDLSIPLHVPVGSKSAYQAATGWSKFTNIIEDL